VSNNRLPPQSLEMEQAVCGAMLIDPEAVWTCASILRQTDFYRVEHGTVFAAVIAVASRGQAVDVLTVQEELRSAGNLETCGGAPYLVHLTDCVPSAANAEYYAKVVAEKATLRRISDAGSQLRTMVYADYDEIGDVCDKAFRTVMDAVSHRDSRNPSDARTLVEEILAEVDKLRETGEIPGLSTGFADLDTATAGFCGGELVIVAGAPSMGKSAFALQIARHVARKHGPVLIVSLEMSGREIMHRQLSIESGIDLLRLRRGMVSKEERETLDRVGKTLCSEPVLIHDRGVDSLGAIRQAVRRMRPEPVMVLVDYLQIMRVERVTDNRAQDLGAICRGLKRLGMDYEMPVVLLSQLSREIARRNDRKPVMSDLRDSGAIEQDADIVLGLYRENYYKSQGVVTRDSPPEEAEILIMKQRNGPRGSVRVMFRPATAQWASGMFGARADAYTRYDQTPNDEDYTD
jgi:replicative DNA helicase